MFNYINAEGTDLRYGKIVSHVLIALVVIVFAFGSIGVVDSREVGIKTRLGQVAGVVEPGLYFKLPVIEHVSKMDMKVQTVDYDKNGKEGDASDTSSLSAASKDLQTVWANIVVNYRLNPVNAVDTYVQYRNTEIFGTSVVEPIIRETVKAITASYTAEELVTKRQEISDRVYADLNEKLTGKGVILVQSNLTNFEYSGSFAASIEKKVTAEQDALTAKNKLEQVKYESEQTIVAAQGVAEAQRIKAAALQSQGGRALVDLTLAEKWDGHLPTTMVPGSSVPFINVQK